MITVDNTHPIHHPRQLHGNQHQGKPVKPPPYSQAAEPLPGYGVQTSPSQLPPSYNSMGEYPPPLPTVSSGRHHSTPSTMFGATHPTTNSHDATVDDPAYPPPAPPGNNFNIQIVIMYMPLRTMSHNPSYAICDRYPLSM